MGAYEFQGEPASIIENAAHSSHPPDGLNISPNPFHSVTTLRLADPSDEVSIVVLDIHGKSVNTFEKVKEGTLTLNFSGLANGLYLVRAASGQKRYQRLITLLK